LGEPANNYLVFKGPIPVPALRQQFPVKYILPANYPMAPPKIYFDFQLPMEVVKSCSYIGEQNMIIFPYIQ
jgi:hypothetical protein